MKRNLASLSNEKFDLLIIGGGIYGATAAWEAVLQGLKVALIEKDDFGSHTSANSLKTIHGGLRYLQTLDFKRMRESILERRALLTIAPHLVVPLTVVMPTYGVAMKSKHALFAGLLLNDIISADRNWSVDVNRKIPMGNILSKSAMLRLLPGIASDKVTGGALWTDAQVYNSERLLLSFILSASEQGLEAANYVKAIGFEKKNNQIQSVKVEDIITGDAFEIQAKSVLNTCGGWVDELLSDIDSSSHVFPLSTAMNIVINRPLVSECAAGVYGNYEYALPNGGSNKGRHVLFMSPWREHTIFGTYHRPYNQNPDNLSVQEQDLDNFLKEVNSAWPGDPVKREEISFVHKGFLPMDGVHPKRGEVKLTKHYSLIDHAKSHQIDNMVSLAGVKYTTARDVSSKAINLLMHKLNKTSIDTKTRIRSLEGGVIPDISTFQKDVHQELKEKYSTRAIDHLIHNYGTLYSGIMDLSNSDNKLSALIPNSDEITNAEVVYAVQKEMAVKLSDVVLRRTDLGTAEYPGDDALKACAELMGKELNWDAKKKQAEIKETQQLYKNLCVLK